MAGLVGAVRASEWTTQKNISVLVAGEPKGAGKTTFALSAPGPKVVLAFDLGRLSIPPGINRDETLVIPYQDLTRVMQDQGTTQPVKDVYLKLTRDLYAVYLAIKNQTTLKFEHEGKEVEFPTPRTVVLDGASRLNNMLVDGQCALNNIAEPSFDVGAKGAAFKFWGTRLRNVLTLTEQFASLPCVVVITCWIDAEKREQQPTGRWFPDLGGKMDLLGAGTVGAALYAYSRGGKFYVKTKADAAYPWLGIRDDYKTPSDVEVTIEPGKPLPFEKVFGGIK